MSGIRFGSEPVDIVIETADIPWVRSHRELVVWHRASDNASVVYRLTAGFPRSETFGLVAQMRRSAISVVSNIAEGAARSSEREFYRFLDIAMGSAGELQAQLDIAGRFEFGDPGLRAAATAQVDEVKRMLASLMQVVRRRAAKRST
ncbi:MAG TPA: four helix bundle protein [Actinobacteria bacterium]|nr:four helix bundle protein [Actinomycetota bacterium]